MERKTAEERETTARHVPPASARLYVLLAREAPVGVVLRRGPKEWVQMIQWDTATDTFTPGQWLRATVHTYECDLSPSGERLLYLAARYRRSRYDPSIGFNWTAVSRVPYWTATALWPHTSYGGGMFASENELWLDGPWSRDDAHPDFRPPEMVTVRPRSETPLWATGSWLGVEYARHLRDGWTWHSDGRTPTRLQDAERDHTGRRLFPSDLYRAASDPAAWVLHLRLEYPNHAYDVRRPRSGEVGEVLPLEGVRWADWDQRGRLVCTRAGRLHEVRFSSKRGNAVPEWRELPDFNESRPEAVPPPEWAKQW
jgi:hypothetical protein